MFSINRKIANHSLAVLRLFALLTAFCVAAVLITEKSHARKYQDIEVVFSSPGERTILRKIIGYINLAKPGSTILMAYYLFDDVPIIESLIEARRRGVDIQILVDDEPRNDMLKSFAADICIGGDKSCIRSCKQSCLGQAVKNKDDESINHMKFILFSALNNGQKNIAIQTSSNLFNTSMNYFQDMLVFKDVREIYNAYDTHFYTMQRENAREHRFRPLYREDTLKVHFFPEPRDSDMVYDLFDEIDCTAQSSIRVGMAYFYDDRPELAKKLAALSQQGCTVEVISGVFWGSYPTYNSPGFKISNILGDNLVKIETSLHSKFVLLNVVRKGEVDRKKIILTGSYNYTWASSYQNDESLVYLENKELYNRYLDYWYSIKDYRSAESRDRTRKVHLYHLAMAIRKYKKSTGRRLVSARDLKNCSYRKTYDELVPDCLIGYNNTVSKRLEWLIDRGYLAQFPRDPATIAKYGYFVRVRPCKSRSCKKSGKGKSGHYQLCASRFETPTSVYRLKPYCVTVKPS